jgi:ubiquinone/menaquinone biosynthesis C-methylase UbiE
MIKNISKKEVHDFWDNASCGEELFLKSYTIEDYEFEFKERYRLEPCILNLADFESACGKKILEIGVGLGADHQRFIEAGAITYGIDLTERAIKNTKRRLDLFNHKSNLEVGDAENIQFESSFFDIVYSWGVIHHSPNTQKAIDEIYRVLKPGGAGKVMIYNKWSFVGLMLWVRYALFRLNPFIGLNHIYSEFLESPGTKAYSKKEAKQMFSSFSSVHIDTVLTHGDLLDGPAGQRHGGVLIKIARSIWPKKIIKKIFPKLGLFMLISLKK